MKDDTLYDITPGDDRSVTARTAYPAALRDAERARWRLKFASQTPPAEPTVGVALSGGGIRSATFSLGVFQAFAGRKFLKHIDFLSTISGGGYFGSFFGVLFQRDYIRSPDDAGSVLLEAIEENSPGTPSDLASAREKVIWWLRENGRYLSPRGAGDQLLFLAVLFRNWLALNIVIALPVIAAMMLMQVVRFCPWIEGLPVPLPGGALIWWSPWIYSVAVPLAFVPSLVWAYFLRDDRGQAVVSSAAATGLVAAIVALGYAPWWFWRSTRTIEMIGAAVITSIVFGAVVFRTAADRDPARAGNVLAQWLRAALAASVALFGLGIADSLGQTAYFQIARGQLGGWIAGVGAAIGAAGAFARQIAVLVGSKSDGNRPSVPLAVIANIGAAVLVLVLATLYSATAHAIAWDGQKPQWPDGIKKEPALVKVEAPANVRIAVAAAPDQSPPRDEPQARRRAWLSFLGWFTAISTLAWGFGQQWRFINYSTQQPLYSARLARAYLGASNPTRWHEKIPVIEPLKSDDFSMTEYWPPLEKPELSKFAKGAPLHLIGVTVNSTVGGRSQIEQRDRKGIGLAIGPCGLSLGVRHHAVFGEELETRPVEQSRWWRRWRGARPDSETAPAAATVFKTERRIIPRVAEAGFNALNYGQNQHPVPFRGERLMLSLWTGLSGAAFSTGLGSRTNLGLSLLTGFFNVRLGYWWNSGTIPPESPKAISVARAMTHGIGWFFQTVLPVHRYLVDEFLARFPGVSRHRWYLSDGGHFENLGAYELLRRRLPLIIIVDAGQDGASTFEDLGNLVRKARTDFDAEITFLEQTELKRLFDLNESSVVRPLDDLRPGGGDNDDDRKGTDRPHSRGYAALARVRYESPSPCELGGNTTALLYIKPGLTGNEAADLVNYGRLHPDFPHESTADQFFDEAQWESYRKLGESIVCSVWDELKLDDPADLIRRLGYRATS